MHMHSNLYLRGLQQHLCQHTMVLSEWLEAQHVQQQDLQTGPIQISPVDEDRFSNIFYISEHESRHYEHSFISTSRGRGSAHIFFISETSCFVKVFRRHQQWRIQCMSPSSSHFGSQAECCKPVYQVIMTVPRFTNKFSPTVDPSLYSRIRIGFDKDEKYVAVQNWSSEPGNHVSARTWDYGNFERPFPEGYRPQGPNIIPAYREGFRVCDGKPDRCRLVTEDFTQVVAVYELVNEEGQRVTVKTDGPGCGLFWASSQNASVVWVYAGRYLYKVKTALLKKNSSIQLEWQELKKSHEADERNTGNPVLLPGLPQYAKHVQRFLRSQVMHELL